MAKTKNFKRVYIWQIPVRFFHWVNAASIFVLVVTGFIIADPPAISSQAEASDSYWFGYLRATHFIAAYIAIAVAIMRLYWAFAGNRFASWKNFIPLSKKGWKNIWYVLKVDIFLQEDKKHQLSNVSIGHNSLAASGYLVMGLLFIFQAMTGLALMSETSDFFLTKMFVWVLPLFGGDITVRYIHHFCTWLFIAFVIVHVYLVLYHDYVEARGEVSSMLSGFKFVRSERISEDEELDTAVTE